MQSSAILPSRKSLQINGHLQLGQPQAYPCRSRKRWAMQMEAKTAKIYPYSISGGVRDMSQGEIANPLNGNAGRYAHNGEEDEGEEVEEHNQAEEEGWAEDHHDAGLWSIDFVAAIHGHGC